MLASGVSQIIRQCSSGDLMSVVINCLWPVDTDYDAFDVDSHAWFEEAGALANREGATPGHRACIWRDFQYQWIHHMLQGVGQRQGARMIFYGGMQYSEPRFRVGRLAVLPVSHGVKVFRQDPDVAMGFLV